MSNPTLKSIAEASGFSITTVSRALGGYDDVNASTREHILSIARELGYQPNLIARQLRSQRTYTIGMVIPANIQGDEDDFFSVLIKGASRAAAQSHYDLLISAQLPDVNEMDAYHRIVGGNRVDGVILARTHQNDPRIEYLRRVQHPFAVSGRLAPDQVSDFPYIDVDSQAGIKLLVEHLVGCGHQEIGIILPPDDIAYTAYRLEGYRDGLRASNLPFWPTHIDYGDLTRRGGYLSAKRLLDKAPALTAIIACNDMMAIGAMNAIREYGYTVGEDFAVGGFDDIPAAEHANPALTTIRQPIYEIGQRLIQMLIRIIEGDSLEESQILLLPELVVRSSSAAKRERT